MPERYWVRIFLPRLASGRGFPKYLQNFVKGNQLRVKHHLHHFIMAGLAAACFFIARLTGNPLRNDLELTPSACQNLRSAPQKQPMPTITVCIVSGQAQPLACPIQNAFPAPACACRAQVRALLVYHFSFHSKHDASLLMFKQQKSGLILVLRGCRQQCRSHTLSSLCAALASPCQRSTPSSWQSPRQHRLCHLYCRSRKSRKRASRAKSEIIPSIRAANMG